MSNLTHEYTLVREVDAPVSTVWRVWTQAADYEQWAYAVPGSVELDVRPGGAWKCGIQTPDGNQVSIGGTYLEVEENRHLVMNMEIPGAEPSPMTLDLKDLGGRTEITLSQRSATAEERDQSKEGSGMLLDSCEQYLAKI